MEAAAQQAQPSLIASRKQKLPHSYVPRGYHAIAALLLLVLASPDSAAAASLIPAASDQATPSSTTYTVGPHANCDFPHLQQAIDAASHGDTLRIARSNAYLGNTYILSGKSLTLRGGFDSCDTGELPSGHTTLDANGAAQRVLDIREGSNPPEQMTVRLENLIVQNGRGGIAVEGWLGRLSLSLANTRVTGNSTPTAGGGVHVVLAGITAVDATGQPLLRIDNASRITHNQSGASGGGIHCIQSAPFDHHRVSLRIGGTLIAHNSAVNGGGIAMNGCARAQLYPSAPFEAGEPTGGIAMNSATDSGGGLFMTQAASLSAFGSNVGAYGAAGHAGVIVGNSAAHGGGVALTANASLNLYGMLVAGNTASGDGGGVLVRDGSLLYMLAQARDRACPHPAELDHETPIPPCNYLSHNESGGHGGALRVINEASALIAQAHIVDNLASVDGSVASVNLPNDGASTFASIWLESSLMSGNSADSTLYAGNRSQITVIGSTISGNDSIGTAYVYAAPGNTSRLMLQSSIVWGNWTDILVTRSASGSALASADCVIGPHPELGSGLSAATDYLFDDPLFIDPTTDNFRLAPGSPAIDFCDDRHGFTMSDNRDLAGQMRGLEWTGAALGTSPALGPVDLGAYEAQPLSMTVFSDSFE